MSMNSNDTNKLMYKNALRNLPSTYRGLEYVANGSSKAAYAVINYTPKIGDEIHVKYMFDEQTQSISSGMCLLSVGTGTYQTILLSNPFNSGTSNNFYFKYFASGDAKNAQVNNNVNTWCVIDIDDTGLLTSGSYTIQSTPEAEIDTVDAKLYLFSRASGTNPFVGKIAEFYITRGEEYKVFLVPCYRKSDDVAGFYDTVGEAFYPSLGTDGFIKGYEVSEYGAIAYETVEGNLVTFESERDKDIKSLVVDIEPVQDLHGYSNPWPAGGGVNKLSYPYGRLSVTSNGITFTVNSDGSIIANGTSDGGTSGIASSYINLKIRTATSGNDVLTLDPGTYWIASFDNDVTISISDTQDGVANLIQSGSVIPRSFVLSEVQTSYTVQCSIMRGKTINNRKFYPIIAKGETAPTSWSPYSNICPITGWTGCEVVRTGKNLIDFDAWNFSYDTMWNGGSSWSGEVPTGNYVLKAGTYTISLNTTINLIAVFTNAGRIAKVNDGKVLTFTLSKDEAVAIRLYKNASGTATKSVYATYNVQMEYSSSATSYVPYTGSTIPISWQSTAGTVYGGHIDVVSGELVVTHGVVDLGTLTWTYDSTYHRFDSNVNELGIAIVGQTRLTMMPCSVFRCISDGRILAQVPDYSIYAGLSSGNKFINVHDSKYTDPTEFKSAMSGVQLVYELATPLTYQLPPTEVKALFTNNIYANTGDVSVQYPKGVLENVGLFNLRRMILQNNDGLPPAYKRVEYVVGSYTASNIDTGVSGNNDNLRIQICFECGFHVNYFSFFGNYNGDGANGWRFMAYTNDTAFLVNANSRCGSSKSMYTPNGDSWLNKKIFADITQPYRRFTMDGDERVDTRELTISETENNTNIAIGANKVTSGSADASKLTKYYFARIYDNGVLIRDYVPCYRISDNKAGFYDMVNNTFNPSQGGADFILP